MSILQLGPMILGETDKIVDCLQSKGLLSSQQICPCRTDVSDGVRFRCPDWLLCISLRDGSFSVSKSRIPL